MGRGGWDKYGSRAPPGIWLVVEMIPKRLKNALLYCKSFKFDLKFQHQTRPRVYRFCLLLLPQRRETAMYHCIDKCKASLLIRALQKKGAYPKYHATVTQNRIEFKRAFRSKKFLLDFLSKKFDRSEH